MKYALYTDASFSIENSLAVAGYLILADNKYCDHGTFVLSTTNPHFAEAFAISGALEVLNGTYTTEDRIDIYTDSLISYKAFQCALKGKEFLDSAGVNKCASIAIDVSKNVSKISLHKVKGHAVKKGDADGNSFVDKLVHTTLQGLCGQ